VADWFSRQLKTRSVGSGFSDSLAEQYYTRLEPAAAFDAILFVDSTTTARPTPRGARVRPVPAAASSNLDFESGVIGSPPPGWTGPERLQADNYRAETRRDEARSGSRCGVIRRLAGPSYGETIGPLDQLLDAAPYRGKRIRLSADVRLDPGAAGAEAYLRLQTLMTFGRKPISRDMYDHPITDRSWRRYAVEGVVPDDAGTLALGLAFAGDGSAWLDNVALEIVEAKTP
jgi:erythromycin esterase